MNSSERFHRLAVAGLYLALFALALVPIFAFGLLPLGDVPNHLARTYILNHLDADPALQRFYEIHWKLFSFQSTDLLLPALARWFGLEAAAQIFVAAAFLTLIAGTVAVHRAFFGRVGIWPAAAFLLLYNFPLAAGQISFLFSTGLSLLLFAAWIASEAYPRSIRLPGFVLASFALLLCHFYAFAAYALLIMSFELGRARHLPSLRAKVIRLVQAGLPFVLPAICFLLSFGKAISGTTIFGSLLGKPGAFMSATFVYGEWPDVVLSLGFWVGLWWLCRHKMQRFAADMKLPVLVLVLTAVAMPRVLQGVIGADVRLPCLLAFLLVAASDVRLERRIARAFLLGLLVLFALRLSTVAVLWQRFEADYREFRAADAALDRGSRVLVSRFADLKPEPLSMMPYWFVGCLAVIDRQVFVPQLYTVATPLTFTPEGTALDGNMPARARQVRWRPASPAFHAVDPGTVRQVEMVGQVLSALDAYTSRIDWSDWPERFDFVVDFHMGRRPGNPVPMLLTEVQRGSYFTIYRIHPPQQR